MSDLHATSSSLATLFDVSPDGPVWRREDLAEMFRHQLDAPLDAVLGPLHAAAGQALLASAHVRTFGDLLTDQEPPLVLLRLAKRYAKARRAGASDDAPPIPPEIDKLLYAAVIVAARVRLGEKISELPDDVFVGNVRWALEQTWTPVEIRELMTAWRAATGT